MSASDVVLFVSALGRASWQASVLVVLVGTVNLLLRRQIPPAWRAIIWTIPLLRLVIIVVPTSALSIFNLLPSQDFAVRPSFLHPNESRANANGDTVRTEPTIGLGLDSLGITSANSPIASDTPIDKLEDPATTQPVLSSFRPSLVTVLASIWLTGVLWQLFSWARALTRMRHLLASTQIAEPPNVSSSLYECRRAIGIHRQVRCIATHSDIGPSVVGLLRPTIVLPARLLETASREELNSILVHELAHVRRRDALLLILERVASTIHWFNPFVYYANRRLREEIELAVDHKTIRILGEEARTMYGELLIKMSQRRTMRLGLGQAAQSPNHLRGRIRELTFPVATGPLPTITSLLVASSIFVTGLTDTSFTQERIRAEVGQTAPIPVLGTQGTTTRSTGEHKYAPETVVLEDVLDELISRDTNSTIRIQWQETHTVNLEQLAAAYKRNPDPFANGETHEIDTTESIKTFLSSGYLVVSPDHLIISTNTPTWTMEKQLIIDNSKQCISSTDVRNYHASMGQGSIASLNDGSFRWNTNVADIFAMHYRPRRSRHYDDILHSSVVRSAVEWAGRPAFKLGSCFFDFERNLLFLGRHNQSDNPDYTASFEVRHRGHSSGIWLIDEIQCEVGYIKTKYENFEYDLDYRPEQNEFFERFPPGTLVRAADKYGRSKPHIALPDGSLALLTDANREQLDPRVRRAK